jgi:hypothetical protein
MESGAARRPPVGRYLIASPDRCPTHLITRTGARLVVIDPLMAHLSGVNSWKDQEIWEALAPVHKLAEELHAAVLLVAHLNEGVSTDPIQRLGALLLQVVAVDEPVETARIRTSDFRSTAEVICLIPNARSADRRSLTRSSFCGANSEMVNARRRKAKLKRLAQGSPRRRFVETAARSALGQGS